MIQTGRPGEKLQGQHQGWMSLRSYECLNMKIASVQEMKGSIIVTTQDCATKLGHRRPSKTVPPQDCLHVGNKGASRSFWKLSTFCWLWSCSLSMVIVRMTPSYVHTGSWSLWASRRLPVLDSKDCLRLSQWAHWSHRPFKSVNFLHLEAEIHQKGPSARWEELAGEGEGFVQNLGRDGESSVSKCLS